MPSVKYGNAIVSLPFTEIPLVEDILYSMSFTNKDTARVQFVVSCFSQFGSFSTCIAKSSDPGRQSRASA